MLLYAQHVMGLFKRFNDITALVNKSVYTRLLELFAHVSGPSD